MGLTLGVVVGLLSTQATPSAAWTTGTIDANSGDVHSSSMTVTPNGSVYVAFERPQWDLLWGQWTGTGWSNTFASSNILSCYGLTEGPPGPQAGTTSKGSWRILSACGNNGTSEIRWSHRVSGVWQTDEIGDVAAPDPHHAAWPTNSALCIDQTTNKAAVFYGDTNDVAVHWLSESNDWLDRNVTASGVGFGVDGPTVACAIDPTSDTLTVATIGSLVSPASLNVLTYDPASGVWTQLGGIPVGDALGIPTLAYTPTGTLWVAFQEGTATASHLAAASYVGGTWTIQTVDATTTLTGLEPSIGIKLGEPKIAYYDGTNKDLRWAYPLGTGWHLQTLASAGQVGEYPSVFVAPDSTAWISYWDAKKKSLDYAHT